ncbi:hypothetical protein OCK74_19355 [Chitinophagaceae bacterium LB-8]|uniref:Acyltransferase n=1 Tax=Paraflavisolibacter caeni TaxID=2982496 RepID=A0A9X3BJJ6_9BACT|nr:DapH/DapD/GlmU-related protein [Paraflavisolibacter caeni]MCU7551288.1 hypothetical protein [Paraflavisolibacter caeni]
MIFFRIVERIRSILRGLLLKSVTIRHEEVVDDSNYKGVKIIGDQSLISIGDSVSFGGNVILFANAQISIGDHSMISINVVIHTSTHDYNNHPMWIERIDKPIKIGKHVWIGVGAIISPGVTIGDFSVIGAGSVVVSNVPERAIVAGNPARIIKYRNIEKEKFQLPVEKYPIGSFISKQTFIDETNICKTK